MAGQVVPGSTAQSFEGVAAILGAGEICWDWWYFFGGLGKMEIPPTLFFGACNVFFEILHDEVGICFWGIENDDSVGSDLKRNMATSLCTLTLLYPFQVFKSWCSDCTWIMMPIVGLHHIISLKGKPFKTKTSTYNLYIPFNTTVFVGHFWAWRPINTNPPPSLPDMFFNASEWPQRFSSSSCELVAETLGNWGPWPPFWSTAKFDRIDLNETNGDFRLETSGCGNCDSCHRPTVLRVRNLCWSILTNGGNYVFKSKKFNLRWKSHEQNKNLGLFFKWTITIRSIKIWWLPTYTTGKYIHNWGVYYFELPKLPKNLGIDQPFQPRQLFWASAAGHVPYGNHQTMEKIKLFLRHWPINSIQTWYTFQCFLYQCIWIIEIFQLTFRPFLPREHIKMTMATHIKQNRSCFTFWSSILCFHHRTFDGMCCLGRRQDTLWLEKWSTSFEGIPGWWFQPIWKILVQLGIFPKRGWK